MPFDVAGARKAGYSETEIADFVAKESKFDIVSARKAGYSDAELLDFMSKKPSSQVDQIPTADPRFQVTQQAAPKAKPSLADQAIGVGEAALTTVTGMTGGALGMAGGTVKGLAGAVMDGTFGTQTGVRSAEKAAADGAAALTYMPRTELGQERAQQVGDAMQALLPAAPLTAEMGAIAAATGQAARGVRDVSSAGVQRIRSAAPAVADRVERVLRRNPDPATPGTRGSAGSAGTDMATMRTQAADNLPVPIALTEGQATRSPDQLRFEVETSKGSQGAALRERAADTNERFQKNFDAMVDMTGAEVVELIDVGKSVERTIVREAARDKAEIRVAYTRADKSGETAAPVALDSLVEHLNESAPDAATAPLLTVARSRALQLGIAAEGPDGQLVSIPTTIKNAERMRQAIGRATDFEATNIRQSAIIKGLIDTSTENMGGELYRSARRLRENFAKKYEDRAAVSSLIGRKRGTADRQVALEDVFSEVMLKGSREDLSYVRRVLQTGGNEGKQSWRDLQGATANWLKDEALKNVATDQRGNRIVSAAQLDRAVRQLEQGGKMDFIFGKQGAQMVRDLNDLAKVTMTTPPGVNNTSNTASVLIAALSEAGVTGSMTGLPVPILSALRLASVQVKNRRIQKRVEQALSNRSNRAGRRPPAPSAPGNQTIH